MIDHIVYAANDLQEGIRQIGELLGVSPVYGGKHPDQGTHNALLAIGHQQYLEIIAPDPENSKIRKPRWMGVDMKGKPSLVRWAMKSDNVAADAHSFNMLNPQLRAMKEGRRETSSGKLLTWQLSIPLPAPRIEVIPFLIDWENSEHPSDSLESKCLIRFFDLCHPSPEKINRFLQGLNSDIRVQKAENPDIRLTLHCPNGIVPI